MAFPKNWRDLFGLKTNEVAGGTEVEIIEPTINVKKQVIRRKRTKTSAGNKAHKDTL